MRLYKPIINFYNYFQYRNIFYNFVLVSTLLSNLYIYIYVGVFLCFKTYFIYQHNLIPKDS